MGLLDVVLGDELPVFLDMGWSEKLGCGRVEIEFLVCFGELVAESKCLLPVTVRVRNS